MKILCVVRNYAPHAGEMKAEVPKEPTFFMKPDSALNPKQMPLFYPDFTEDLQHEAEIVVKIDRLGKCIEPRFAHRYYHEVALGIDFTARDLQRQAKAAGLPWLVSKGFDGSAVVGPFVTLEELGSMQGKERASMDDINFELRRNGSVVQKGNTGEMIFDVDSLIAHISRFMTLRTGDLIFTGTPAGVGPVQIGDVLDGTIEGKTMLHLEIK